MHILFPIWLPMLPFALGIFLVLKTHKLAWKMIGWALVAITGLLIVLLTWTGRSRNSLPIFQLTRGLPDYRFTLSHIGDWCPLGRYDRDGKSVHRLEPRRPV